MFCILLTVTAASCGTTEDVLWNKESNLVKLSTMNLSRVKALGIQCAQNVSRAGEVTDPGLLKLDDSGNVSTIGIVSEVIDKETGEVITKEVMMTVKPRLISDLALYTLLWDCSFVDSEGNDCYGMKQFYEPNSTTVDFHLMIRKSDGHIFYVPTSGNDNELYLGEIWRDVESFSDYNIAQGSPQGEVFITTFQGNLYKLEESGDNINVIKITDGIIGALGGIVFANDGSIMVNSRNGGTERYDACAIIKPNGEIFRHQVSYGEEEIIGYSCTAGRFLATRTISKKNDRYGVDIEFSIHEVNEDYSLGRELFHVDTDYSPNYGLQDFTLGWHLKDYAPRIYESDNYYIVGSFLAIDKTSGEYKLYDIRDWHSNVIVFPQEDKSNFYNDKVWGIGFDEAAYFDPDTLQGGIVTYSRTYADVVEPGVSWRAWPMINNLKSGEVTFYKEENGKTIFYKVDITTGNETISESDYVLDSVVPIK